MADFNSKYSGEQVETMLDQIANGEAGGGGGIAVETDPIFSASPAASITTEKISAWDDKEDKPIIFDAEKAGIEAGDGSEEYPGTFTPEQFQLATGMTFAEFREAVLTGKRVVLRFGDSTIEPEAVYVTDDSIQVSYTKYTGLLGVALYCSTEYMALSSALLTNSFYEIFYTKEEIDTNKQDKIADLDAIRSGAEKGATALQSVPSEYVTETELNDKGYLTSVPAEYVTETELTNKGYATTSDLDEKVDKVSGKQLSTEDFTSALKTKLEGLSNYDDTEIENAITSLQTQFNTLVSGNASDAINSFNEIVAFLDGVKDTEELSSIIASIEQQIAGKMDNVTLATVATSGSYNDLSNKPTIPSEQVNADWNATSGKAQILNKPTIPSAVTESTVSGWGFTKNTGTYSKPSTGIPKTDLASAVQTSLGRADTALQSYTEQYKGTVTKVKINGSEKSPDSNGVVDLGTISGGSSSSASQIITVTEPNIRLGVVDPLVFDGRKYVCSSSMDAIELGDAIDGIYSDVTGDYGEVSIIFVASERLYLATPSNLLWANGQIPAIEDGVSYELSVVASKVNNTFVYKAVLTPFKIV